GCPRARAPARVRRLSGSRPVDLRLLHHRHRDRSPRRRCLEPRREVAPRLHLRDDELQRPDVRVPCPRPVAVSVRRPFLRPLIPLAADAARDLRLHQRLGRTASRRTSPSCSARSLPTNAERSILPLAIAPLLRALRLPACAVGRCRWPFPFPASQCLAPRPEFPPRPGTLRPLLYRPTTRTGEQVSPPNG